MKIMNKFSVVMLSILFTSTLAGCELISTKDENQAAVGVIDASNAKVVSIEDTTQLLKDGFFNLGEIDSASYDANVKGDFTAPEGSAKLDITISGESDGKDKTKPKFTLKFDGSGDIKSDDINANLAAEAELKMNEISAYFTLTKLSGLDTIKDIDAGTIAMIEANIGKWWKMDIPEGAFDGIEAISPKTDESKMTEFEKEMKKLAEDTNFFSEVKLVSSNKNTNVYDLTLDIEATKAYTIEAAKLTYKEESANNIRFNEEFYDDINEMNDTTQEKEDVKEMTAEEIEELKAALDKQFESLEIRSLQVSYNTKFNVISGLVVSLKSSFDGGVKFDGDIAVGLANFNEDVKIAEPKNAELFDPAAMFGFGGAPEMDYDMNADYDMNTDTDAIPDDINM